MIRRLLSLYFVFYFSLFLSVSAQPNAVDSLFEAYEQTSDKIQKVKLANEVMLWFLEHQYTSDPVRFSRKVSDDSLKMLVEGYMSSYYFECSDFSNTIKYSDIAISASRALQDSTNISDCYDILAKAYIRIGNYEKALEALQVEYEIEVKRDNKINLSGILNQLGALYSQMHKDSVGIYYLGKSLEMERALQHHKGRDLNLAIRLSNLAELYEKTGNREKALTLVKEAMTIDSLADRKKQLAIRRAVIAKIYAGMGAYTEAESYYKQAIKDLETYQMNTSLCITLSEMGRMYRKNKRADKAISYLEQCLTMSEKLKMYDRKRVALYDLYLLHKDKNPQQSLNYLERYNLLKDSIYTTKTQKQLNDFEVKYKTQEKEQQITLQQEKLKNRNRVLWFLGIFSVLGLIVTFVIYRLWQSRNRQNQHLAKLNQTKDKLFSIISHDLKSPAIAQKIAMDSLKPEIEKTDNELLKSGYDILHENVTNQVSIINNMMDWARVQTDKIIYKPQNIDVVNIIKEEVKLYNVAIEQKSIQLHLDLPKSCIALADRQMIAIVVRNLINNAVKFTKEKGRITVKCHCDEKEAVISIFDNGVGMTQQQINALYTSEQRIEVRFGTKGEKGTGLGLILCKDLLERNGSRLLIDSKPEKGTTIHFSLRKQ